MGQLHPDMKNAIVLLACASSLVFSGCVSTPPSTVTSGPLVETRVDLRHSGRVAVVAFSSAAEVNVLMPSNKSEAVRHATDGFQLMAARDAATVAAMFGYPLAGPAFFTIPVVVPTIAAVAGGIDTLQSWVRAESEHNLAPSREALQAAVAGVRLETLVRDRILAELRGETKQPLVLIDDATLREINPRLSERAWRNDAGLSLKARQALAARGLHRVLEIKVHAPALVAPSPLDRDLALSAQVRVRLVTVPEGIELYRRETNYFGAARPYPEWAANGAALVRAELGRCIDTATVKATDGLVHHRAAKPAAVQFAVASR